MRVTSPPRRHTRLLALGVVAALAMAACSGDDDDTGDTGNDSGSETQVEDATDAAAAATDRAEEAEAEVEVLTADLEAAEADVEAAEARTEAAEAEAEAAQELAAMETERADAAEAQIQGVIDMFPVIVESTLEGIELEQEGTWNLTWHEAYCDTFDFCGTLPSTTQMNFVRTPENWLRVQVPGIIDAGLFAVDGSLYAITDTSTALPPCPDGTPRQTRVTVVTYADDVVIDAEGNRDVTGLAGSITIDAPWVPDCPGGIAFYGVAMDR